VLRQHEHDLRAAKARRKVMCRRAEVSRTSGIHGTAAARFGGTIDQASSTECAQHIHPRPGSYAPEGQDRPSFAWSSTYFMSSSFVSVVNEPGQSTPALAPLLALRAVSDRQDFRPLRGGPRVRLQLVLGDDRAEVSRDDLERLEHRPQCEELGVVLRALAVVAATRILGWKMSDDTPTPAAGCSGIEVDGRCQLVVATVAHVAQADEMSVLRLDEPEPRVPQRVGPVQGLEQRRVDLTSAVCSDSCLLAKTLDSVHVTANKPGTRCGAEHTHYRAADRFRFPRRS